MSVSPAAYRRIALVALFAIVAITLSGAAVRLTGSGLGCDDWPRCSEQHLIDVGSYHAAIEQINRLFTALIGLATLGALIGAGLRRPFRRDLVWYSAGLVGFTAANAVLGGISVLVDLHPLAIQGHMLLSLGAVSLATVLVRRSSDPDGAERVVAIDPGTDALVRAQFGLTWLAVALGTVVTAAGPHAGDAAAPRLDVAIATVARLHSAAVWIALAVGAVVAMRAVRHPSARALRPAIQVWLWLVFANGIVGYVQYFAGIPPALVEVHILGAIAVVWAATNLMVDRSVAKADTAEMLARPNVVT